jgi:hypothetical protein
MLLILFVLVGLNINAEDSKLELADSSTVVERLTLVFSSAQQYVAKYESMNGKELGNKISKYIKNDLDVDSDNVLDAQMVKKFKDIKEKHEAQKEIEPKLIYEACYLLLIYKNKESPLPTCIADVFKENPEAVRNMLKIISGNSGKDTVLLVKKEEEKEP